MQKKPPYKHASGSHTSSSVLSLSRLYSTYLDVYALYLSVRYIPSTYYYYITRL